MVKMSAKDDILRQSGPLNIPPSVLDAASSVQTQILIMINDEKNQREHTNEIIFEKLDAAADLARTAGQVAQSAHDETRGIKTLITEKFTDLNGSVGKAIDRLRKLETKDGDRDAEALREAVKDNAVKVATKGVWMMPKPTWRQLTVIGGVVAFVGADRLVSVFRMVAHLLGKL
jgi:hypothetical protein